SWIEILPVWTPFIFSLKVRVNASLMSLKSVLPALPDIRASTIVGGVKSAAPVVNVVEEFVGKQTLNTFLISPQAPVNVRVYVVAAGRTFVVWSENELSAVCWLLPHGLVPIASKVGSPALPL